MLLAGTTDHLEDLDRQYSLAEDTAVTAIAPAPPGRLGGDVHVLLDCERIARIDQFELVPVAQLGAADAQSMAAADDSLVVGTAGAHLSSVGTAGGDVAHIATFDSVEGRSEWENPAGPSPDLRSIAVSRLGSWFANVHVGGVWRSVDAGETWTNVVPPAADVHEIVAGADGTLAVAAAGGFAWSTDDGRTWQWTSDGLHASYCRAVALDGDAAYVSASTGPDAADGRLYRGRVGGAFEQCTGSLPESFPFNLDTGSVAADGGRVAIGTRTGEVWRSTDGGTTFERMTERIGHVRVLRFV